MFPVSKLHLRSRESIRRAVSAPLELAASPGQGHERVRFQYEHLQKGRFVCRLNSLLRLCLLRLCSWSLWREARHIAEEIQRVKIESLRNFSPNGYLLLEQTGI